MRRLGLGFVLVVVITLATVPAEAAPLVSVPDVQQYAAATVENLGGGTVTLCVRHGRRIVRCRADLAAAPCHIWVQAHAHHGYVYWHLPRAAYCDDGLVLDLDQESSDANEYGM